MSITIFSATSVSVRRGVAQDHNDSKIITVALVVMKKKVCKLCLKYMAGVGLTTLPYS